jgi:hypothetical protein
MQRARHYSTVATTTTVTAQVQQRKHSAPHMNSEDAEATTSTAHLQHVQNDVNLLPAVEHCGAQGSQYSSLFCQQA